MAEGNERGEGAEYCSWYEYVSGICFSFFCGSHGVECECVGHALTVKTIEAGAGHLSMLKYLRSRLETCPWGVGTYAHAVLNGHLHVLQWARSQPEPCPWDEMTVGMTALLKLG
jgi:hypothetical protein